MTHSNETGSHVVGIAVGIVVLALVGFASYRVLHHSNSVATTGQKAAVSAPATINSKADLQQAAQSLDSSSTDINSSLDTTALNDNLNDLL